jgi:CspA family cold shock protein
MCRQFSVEQYKRGEYSVQGTIARWFEHRGFGFIDVENQPNDIFVHVSDVNGFVAPRMGDNVEFEVQDTYKGPRAVNVELT